MIGRLFNLTTHVSLEKVFRQIFRSCYKGCGKLPEPLLANRRLFTGTLPTKKDMPIRRKLVRVNNMNGLLEKRL